MGAYNFSSENKQNLKTTQLQSIDSFGDIEQQQLFCISDQINKLNCNYCCQASKDKFILASHFAQNQQNQKNLSKSITICNSILQFDIQCKKRQSQLNNQKKEDDFQTDQVEPKSILFSGMQLLQFIKEENVYDHYIIIEKIKKGERGLIYKVQHKQTHQIKILKIVPKISFRSKIMINGVYQIQNLLKLKHDNIVKLEGAYEDINQYYLIFQFIEGMNLLQYMKEYQIIEQTGRYIIKQLLQILQYIHKQGVIHKNIKLQNIMILKNSKNNQLLEIKLIDFGMSIDIQQATQQKQVYGSIYYAPPEALEYKINTKYDIWSIGILAMIIFLNTQPSSFWQGQYLRSLFKKGQTFRHNLKKLPVEVKQFVFELLTIKNKRRPSASQALKIQWISGKKGLFKCHRRKGMDIDQQLSLKP